MLNINNPNNIRYISELNNDSFNSNIPKYLKLVNVNPIIAEHILHIPNI